MAEACLPTGLAGDLLSLNQRPHAIAADIKMVGAIVSRSRVSEPLRRELFDRLAAIVRKETVTVATMDGSIEVEGPADRNAIAAAAVLAKMDDAAQRDEHQAVKDARIDAGLATDNVGFTVNILPMGYKG